MIKVLTINNEYKSACKLGFLTYCESDMVRSDGNDIVIRWGNSYDPNDKDFENVINSSDSIALNCSKNTALEKISLVVNTPQIYLEEVPPQKHVVYRPTTHTGGQCFKVICGPQKIEQGYYATEYIKTKTELRVWYVKQYGILVAKRIKIDKSTTEYPCRSNWGYEFIKSNNKLKQQVELAFNAIGLEIGAADVLVKNRKYYFLELNSAATIDHSKIKNFYQKGIVVLCKNKFPGINNE